MSVEQGKMTLLQNKTQIMLFFVHNVLCPILVKSSYKLLGRGGEGMAEVHIKKLEDVSEKSKLLLIPFWSQLTVL